MTLLRNSTYTDSHSSMSPQLPLSLRVTLIRTLMEESGGLKRRGECLNHINLIKNDCYFMVL